MLATESKARVLVASIVAFFGSFALAHAEGAFTAESQRFASPGARKAGEDNHVAQPSRNGQPFHFHGEDCSRCHVEGGKATNSVFTMSGTIYRDYEGSEPLEGAEILLLDGSGKTVSMTSNAEGNFATDAPLRGGNYKAWVRNGGRTMPMMTVPTIGTTSSWMSCNMHHTPGSTRGALFVPTGRTLRGPYPTKDVSFQKHVKPILLSQCRPCHIPAESQPITTQTVAGAKVTYDYSGGLDLTSYVALSAHAKLLDPNAPALIGKLLVTSGEPHAGGKYWYESDPDYQVIRQWIVEGAKGD